MIQAFGPDPHAMERLEEKAAELVAVLAAGRKGDGQFDQQLASIQHFGTDAMAASAASARRTLERRMAAAAVDQRATEALQQLRERAQALDPGRRNLLARPKLFGWIPLGRGLAGYFNEYPAAQHQLNHTLQALYQEQDQLRKENAATEREQQRLRQAIERLQQYLYAGQAIDRRLELLLAQPASPTELRREDLLFPLRQRLQDLHTQLAVSMQGWMALELIHSNNQALLQGIERAVITTLSALHTAILVARGLTRQKLLLEEVRQSASSAGHALAAAASGLESGQAQAAVPMDDAAKALAQLHTAFADLYAVMDEVNSSQQHSNTQLQQRMETLEALHSA